MTLAKYFIPSYQPANGVHFPPPAKDVIIRHMPAHSREGVDLPGLSGLFRVEFNLPQSESLDWFTRYSGLVYVFTRTPKFVTQAHQYAKRQDRWVETYANVDISNTV